MSLLACHHLHKNFGTVSVLHDINLTINSGETLAITGVSGSGKSTLLHCLGGLDAPNSGDVFFEGANLTQASTAQKNLWRREKMGFVYQFHYLIAELTAQENVALPLMIAGKTRAQSLSSAEKVLGEVGLAHRLRHRPSALSGGERQRVAVARAFVHRPALILADEPTGSLDHDNAASLWALLKKSCQDYGSSLIVATHDTGLAQQCARQMALQEHQLRVV